MTLPLSSQQREDFATITVTFAKLSQYLYIYNDSESKESIQQCMSVADTVDSSDDLIVSLGHSYPQATLSTCQIVTIARSKIVV